MSKDVFKIYMFMNSFIELHSAEFTKSIPFFRVDETSNDLVFVVDTESLFVPSSESAIPAASSSILLHIIVLGRMIDVNYFFYRFNYI